MGLCRKVSFRPSFHLAAAITFRMSELAETRGFIIERMQRGQVFNKALANCSSQIVRSFRRLRRTTAYDLPAPALHEIEFAPDNVFVIAAQHGLRGPRINVGQLRQYIELSSHVVCGLY